MKRIISILVIMVILSGMALFLCSCESDETNSSAYKNAEKWSCTKISSRGSAYDEEFYYYLFDDGSYERWTKANGKTRILETGDYEKTNEGISFRPRGASSYYIEEEYNAGKTGFGSGDWIYYKQY